MAAPPRPAFVLPPGAAAALRHAPPLPHPPSSPTLQPPPTPLGPLTNHASRVATRLSGVVDALRAIVPTDRYAAARQDLLRRTWFDVPAARRALAEQASLWREAGVVDDDNAWALAGWPLHVSQALAAELRVLDDAGWRVDALAKALGGAMLGSAVPSPAGAGANAAPPPPTLGSPSAMRGGVVHTRSPPQQVQPASSPHSHLSPSSSSSSPHGTPLPDEAALATWVPDPAAPRLLLAAAPVEAALGRVLDAPLRLPPPPPSAVPAALTAGSAGGAPAVTPFAYIHPGAHLAGLRARAAPLVATAVRLLTAAMRQQGTRLRSGGSRFDSAQRLRSIHDRAAWLRAADAGLLVWREMVPWAAGGEGGGGVAGAAEPPLLPPAVGELMSALLRVYADAAEAESGGDGGGTVASSAAAAPYAARVPVADAVAALLEGAALHAEPASPAHPRSLGDELAAAASSSSLPSPSEPHTPPVGAAPDSSPAATTERLLGYIRAGRDAALREEAAALAAGALGPRALTAASPSGMTPLRLAVSVGSLPAVRALLDAGAPAACPASDDSHALHWAAAKGGPAGLAILHTALAAMAAGAGGASAPAVPAQPRPAWHRAPAPLPTLLPPAVRPPLDSRNYAGASPLDLVVRAPTNDAASAVAAVAALVAAGADSLALQPGGAAHPSTPLRALAQRHVLRVSALSADAAVGVPQLVAECLGSASADAPPSHTPQGCALDLTRFVGDAAWSDVTLAVPAARSCGALEVRGQAGGQAGGARIPAHRLLLAASSEYFATLFNAARRAGGGAAGGSVIGAGGGGGGLPASATAPSSPWVEASTGVVEVHGATVASVRAVLQLMYGGGGGGASPVVLGEVGGAVDALALGCRWLLAPHLLAQLQAGVARQVSPGNAAALLEVVAALGGGAGALGAPATAPAAAPTTPQSPSAAPLLPQQQQQQTQPAGEPSPVAALHRGLAAYVLSRFEEVAGCSGKGGVRGGAGLADDKDGGGLPQGSRRLLLDVLQGLLGDAR